MIQLQVIYELNILHHDTILCKTKLVSIIIFHWQSVQSDFWQPAIGTGCYKIFNCILYITPNIPDTFQFAKYISSLDKRCSNLVIKQTNWGYTKISQKLIRINSIYIFVKNN